MHRRLAAVGLLSLAIAGLAACTAPSPDLDAAREWVDTASVADNERADVVGSAVLLAEPAQASEEEDEELPGITLDFPAPGVTVEGFEVSCYGGGIAELSFEVTSVASSYGIEGGEVSCDEKPHAFSTGDPYDGVTAVRIDVTASATTYAYVSVVGSTPEADAWVGHFDELADGFAGASSVSWGSFGSPTEVQPVRDTDQTLPAGEHVILVQCAGAELVALNLIPGLDGSAPAGDVVAQDLECPSATRIEMHSAVEGLTVDLDSHGQPGAFLYAVDPES